jgi:hypothetical protein
MSSSAPVPIPNFGSKFTTFVDLPGLEQGAVIQRLLDQLPANELSLVNANKETGVVSTLAKASLSWAATSRAKLVESEHVVQAAKVAPSSESAARPALMWAADGTCGGSTWPARIHHAGCR